MKKVILTLAASLLASTSFSAQNYQTGNISNLTATTGGIMIMMDSGTPTHCSGTPYGWLLIKQEHTALTATVLAAWASGSKYGTVYTSGIQTGSSYCIVNQFDPAN